MYIQYSWLSLTFNHHVQFSTLIVGRLTEKKLGRQENLHNLTLGWLLIQQRAAWFLQRHCVRKPPTIGRYIWQYRALIYARRRRTSDMHRVAWIKLIKYVQGGVYSLPWSITICLPRFLQIFERVKRPVVTWSARWVFDSKLATCLRGAPRFGLQHLVVLFSLCIFLFRLWKKTSSMQCWLLSRLGFRLTLFVTISENIMMSVSGLLCSMYKTFVKSFTVSPIPPAGL